jgi:sigma-B regulation protein RsbU (phosphoserine phosphatase)
VERDLASILICDDQPDVVSALHFLLKGAGHATVLTHSPRAALDALEARQLDLVLTDMNFTRDTTSGQEGLELVERIRRRRDAPAVVVMTAWGDVDLAVQAMRRGAVDFVQKPWDNTRLLATVDRCVAEARSSRNEMEIARNVQQKLLPDRVLELPGLRAEARFEPAREVGGDYYDFFPLGGDALGFVLADVSGKGVPAALLMANLQALFRAQEPALLAQPAKLMERINRLFHEATESARFATVFYGVVRGEELRWANCGHPPAVLRRKGDVAAECPPTATLLGMFPQLAVEERSVTLASGDSLYICSDGVLEEDIAEDDRTEIEVFVL